MRRVVAVALVLALVASGGAAVGCTTSAERTTHTSTAEVTESTVISASPDAPFEVGDTQLQITSVRYMSWGAAQKVEVDLEVLFGDTFPVWHFENEFDVLITDNNGNRSDRRDASRGADTITWYFWRSSSELWGGNEGSFFLHFRGGTTVDLSPMVTDLF